MHNTSRPGTWGRRPLDHRLRLVALFVVDICGCLLDDGASLTLQPQASRDDVSAGSIAAPPRCPGVHTQTNEHRKPLQGANPHSCRVLAPPRRSARCCLPLLSHRSAARYPPQMSNTSAARSQTLTVHSARVTAPPRRPQSQRHLTQEGSGDSLHNHLPICQRRRAAQAVCQVRLAGYKVDDARLVQWHESCLQSTRRRGAAVWCCRTVLLVAGCRLQAPQNCSAATAYVPTHVHTCNLAAARGWLQHCAAAESQRERHTSTSMDLYAAVQ